MLSGGLLWLGLISLASVEVQAQPKSPRPQYRHRSVSIPAASASEPVRPAFSSAAAKKHVDLAAELWSEQQQCVSCHTHGIYTYVRPQLAPQWGDPAPETRKFLEAQARELRESNDIEGSTPVQMAYMARGLAAWDAQFNQNTSSETDAALRHLIGKMQAEDGSIRVRFRYPPINSDTWHGSAMAAIAVATAPGWFDKLQNKPLLAKIAKLKSFLRDTPPQNDHHRLLLLWTAAHWEDFLDKDRKQQLMESVWNHQRPDGGWSVRTFATPETLGGGAKAQKLKNEPNYKNPPSDGYQTGIAVIVLRDAGIPANDPRIQNAVNWLRNNQRESGRWWTKSLNTDSRFHFISFSGTAYAALALAKCDALEPTAD